MPRTTIVEIPLPEQARMRAELRRARYGYLLALHLLLLCAAGRTPSEVASRALLFALQRVSDRPGVPGREAHASMKQASVPRNSDGCGCSPRRSNAPFKRCSRPRPGLWLVSHAVELCHVSGGAAGAAGDSGVSGDHAPLAP